MAEEILLNAPNAGTPNRTMVIAVQKTTAGQKLQHVTIADMALDGNPINANNVDYQFVTPKDFNLALATEANEGIIKKVTDAEITAGTAGSALTANKQDQLFKNNTGQEDTLDASDLDSINTGSTSDISSINIIVSNLGNMRVIDGSFSLSPTSDVSKLEIVFNNGRQPVITHAGTLAYVSSAFPTYLGAGSATIEPVGGDTAGIGQVKLTFGTEQNGLNWDNAFTYTLAFSFIYRAKF